MRDVGDIGGSDPFGVGGQREDEPHIPDQSFTSAERPHMRGKAFIDPARDPSMDSAYRRHFNHLTIH
jgi:hypothetical protein